MFRFPSFFFGERGVFFLGCVFFFLGVGLAFWVFLFSGRFFFFVCVCFLGGRERRGGGEGEEVVGLFFVFVFFLVFRVFRFLFRFFGV